MKHVMKLSRPGLERFGKQDAPAPADAKSDFINAVERAWDDYWYMKKNQF